MAEWRAIEDYPGYKVSDDGKVFSMKRNRLLTISEHGDGYKAVKLSNNGNGKTLLVHRLVYKAFAGTIPNGYVVNHKDEDKSNNSLRNLEAITHAENVNFGTRTQRAVESNKKWIAFRKKRMSSVMRTLKGRAVLQYTLDGVLVHKWETMAEAKESGFRDSAICDCCSGRIKTHKGYRWEYEEIAY